jgi:hypothetical protein
LTDDAATQRTETLIIVRPMVFRQKVEQGGGGGGTASGK